MKKLLLSLGLVLTLSSATTVANADTTGSLTIENQTVNFNQSDYIGFSSDANNMYHFQSIIDQGRLGMQAHPFSVNDNLNTHFYGHNPGIMSEVASKIKENSIITMKDFEGNTRKYKMKVVTKYPANYEIPEGSWLEQAIWGYNGETITIQYCLPEENNIPIIWIGYPV